MKTLRLTMLAMVFILGCTLTEAKPIMTDRVWAFGFSASFKDSIIYVTDIQNVEGAWIETKHKMLLGRDEYSRQLKNYLADTKGEPGRVCVVFFQLNRKKAEKQFKKLMKKYKKGYEVRFLNSNEFRFEAIEALPDDE